MEVAQVKQPLDMDSAEADSTIQVGTRKLMAVMFWLLKIDFPSQEDVDNYISEVAEYD